MIHVHDLVEPGFEKIALTAVPPLPRPHRITSPLSHVKAKRITLHAADQFARKPMHTPLNPGKRKCFPTPQTHA
jgi:hypothetical protein